jgi:hypothetical protein
MGAALLGEAAGLQERAYSDRERCLRSHPAATEERLGLVAVMQAESESGGDYYLMPTGREVPHDRDLNLEMDDIALLEVSGIDFDNDTKMKARLIDKADQVREQEWMGRAIAGVVGFRGARVWLREA